jgi:hypothetical protein
MDALKAGNIPCENSRCIKINNSAFFHGFESDGCDDSDEDDDESSDDDDVVGRSYWNKGYKAIQKFFTCLKDVTPKSLNATGEIDDKDINWTNMYCTWEVDYACADTDSENGRGQTGGSPENDFAALCSKETSVIQDLPRHLEQEELRCHNVDRMNDGARLSKDYPLEEPSKKHPLEEANGPEVRPSVVDLYPPDMDTRIGALKVPEKRKDDLENRPSNRT